LKAGPCRLRPETPPLGVGGLERLSAVDWPGMLVAVVFCQGCGWRCRYCHNPHLVPFAPTEGIAWGDVLGWLARRRGLLDGVVFSGGEATLQPGLGDAMRQVRALGFGVGLHTAGPSPANLARVISLVDWVGFDFKAPFDAYAAVAGRDQGARARESYGVIREAGTACEVRTTWHPALLAAADLSRMADTLVSLGCSEWVIQRFRPEGCADRELRETPPPTRPEVPGRRPGLRIVYRD
jgi:pyruvate formate lyase activating enzyme